MKTTLLILCLCLAPFLGIADPPSTLNPQLPERPLASGTNPQPSTLNPQPSTPPSTLNSQLPERPPTSGSNTFATMATLDDKHKLTLGDKLSFRILEDQEDPEESMDPKPLIVTDHGDVEVPYINRFPAVGKSRQTTGPAN